MLLRTTLTGVADSALIGTAPASESEVPSDDEPISLIDGDDYVVLADGEHVLPDISVCVTPDGEVDLARLTTACA